MELLKISIKARIEDFDRFYNKNFQDFRISFFEKQKFRLRKLLHEASASDLKENENEHATDSNELEIKFQIEDDVNMYTLPKSSLRNLAVRTAIKAPSLCRIIGREKVPINTRLDLASFLPS